ncbi:RipA family octameric membrane protein [Streptomyces sp. NPDC054796]
MTGIREALWNDSVGPSSYADAEEKYQSAVFEQYKLCVEMADRVSARRNLANTFFLSLNSVIITVLTPLLGDLGGRVSVWLMLPGLLILLSMCVAWYMLVRSYRQLNGAKFAVIGAMEERLPAFAYSRAEWRALGEGKDWRRYLPFSHVEQSVPVIFVLAYLMGFLVLTR